MSGSLRGDGKDGDNGPKKAIGRVPAGLATISMTFSQGPLGYALHCVADRLLGTSPFCVCYSFVILVELQLMDIAWLLRAFLFFLEIIVQCGV